MLGSKLFMCRSTPSKMLVPVQNSNVFIRTIRSMALVTTSHAQFIANDDDFNIMRYINRSTNVNLHTLKRHLSGHRKLSFIFSLKWYQSSSHSFPFWKTSWEKVVVPRRCVRIRLHIGNRISYVHSHTCIAIQRNSVPVLFHLSLSTIKCDFIFVWLWYT